LPSINIFTDILCSKEIEKMPRDSRYNQGKFHPQNPEKYKGDVKNIIYRSSWELKFMRWCDRNPNVIEYASEEFCIPYISPLDNKVHRYFPDFIVKIKEKSGEIKKYVIEVKPKKQTIPPSQSSKKQTKTFINEVVTYQKNLAKWKAAEEFCKDRMLEFKIITEQELGIK
jgi:hypothetical protein